ncbi:MAG: hypothetical protein IJU58_00910 [Clostridia bacterium]|nr:hypothetical protein [Clostridia bacterium]
MEKNNDNTFIRCPRCELNFIHKKDKLCSVCKKEMEQAFNKDDESDIDFGVDFDICPVCKTNYIRDDEEMCMQCRKERDLNNDYQNDDDILENEDADDTDGVVADDELGDMVSITDASDDDLVDLDLDMPMDEDLGLEDIDAGEFDDDIDEEEEEDELDKDFEDDFDDDFDDEDEEEDDDDFDEDDEYDK